MGLSGLEIYKHLPKKNCGECKVPTCLAFAMNLASGKASLEDCPYVSDEVKELLGSASAPPIALVTAGKGETLVEMGDETELFRHDKKFNHETAVAVRIDDTLSEIEIEKRIKEINGLTFQRVGLEYKIQFAAVRNASGDPGTFAECVRRVAKGCSLALILESEDPAAIGSVIGDLGDVKPVISAATAGNYEEMVSLAKKADCPLVIRGKDLHDLAGLVEKVTALGHKQLILDSGSREMSRVLADLTQIRRLAVKEKFRPFGYPAIAFTSEEDPMFEIVQAATYVSKYAGVVVINTAEKAHLLPLLTWRQNLYTDPQVPIQVRENLYAVGEVDETSPVYVTTNFSLTYYSVESEVEASKIPGYILAVDTDGTSVLTAYASGKFEPERIAEALKKYGVEEKVKHRTVVIPGLVAVITAKLKEVSGWEVLVGPREATGIPSFVKSNFAKGA